MKKTILLLIAVAFLAACGSSPQPQITSISDVPRTEQEVVVAGTPVTLADLSVEGMTCEMMCGGAIRKALAKLPGVSGTEIRFSEGEGTDHAVITYDPGQVSDAELVKAVEALHDGQYKVSSITITHQVQGAVQEGDEHPAKEEHAVSAALPQLEMPNLLRFLSRLMRI